MTYMKYLSIATVLLVFTTALADASIAGYGTSRTEEKITIFGHTGQDPVHKSIGWKDKHVPPNHRKPITANSLYFDFTNNTMPEMTNLSNWLATQHDSELFVPTVGTNLAIWNASRSQPPYNQFDTPFEGGLIPAPPAFLLLLSGLASQRRRKT